MQDFFDSDAFIDLLTHLFLVHFLVDYSLSQFGGYGVVVILYLLKLLFEHLLFLRVIVELLGEIVGLLLQFNYDLFCSARFVF
jgi:hypothetical protein